MLDTESSVWSAILEIDARSEVVMLAMWQRASRQLKTNTKARVRERYSKWMFEPSLTGSIWTAHDHLPGLIKEICIEHTCHPLAWPMITQKNHPVSIGITSAFFQVLPMPYKKNPRQRKFKGIFPPLETLAILRSLNFLFLFSFSHVCNNSL